MKINWKLLLAFPLCAIICLPAGYLFGKRQGIGVGKKQGIEIGEKQGLEKGKHSLKCNSRISFLGAQINADEAFSKIEAYGEWAGELSVAYQQLTCNTTPVPEKMQMPAGWTLPFGDTNSNGTWNDSVRAYIGIERGGYSINGLPELVLILARMDGKKDLDKANKFTNLIRPCPSICDTTSLLHQAYWRGFTSAF